MISLIQCLQKVKNQLVQTRTVNEQLCRAFLDLPVESLHIFNRAMVFGDFELFIGPVRIDNFEVQEADYIRVVGLMLPKSKVAKGKLREERTKKSKTGYKEN